MAITSTNPAKQCVLEQSHPHFGPKCQRQDVHVTDLGQGPPPPSTEDQSSNLHDINALLFLVVKSCYHDRMLPDENELKRRLKEICEPLGRPELQHVWRNKETFLQLYANQPGIYIVTEDINGVDVELDPVAQAGILDSFVDPMFNVVNVGARNRNGPITIRFRRPLASGILNFRGFVDIESIANPYPAYLWNGFRMFLQEEIADVKAAGEAVRDEIPLKKGKFGFSKGLKEMGLWFLEGRSLGEIFHIVDLAFRHRLLSFENAEVTVSNGNDTRRPVTVSHGNDTRRPATVSHGNDARRPVAQRPLPRRGNRSNPSQV